MKYLILTTLLLTGCQCKKIDRRIYQPELLLLPPLTEVQTTEGLYISDPESVERWYPAKKVDELEKIISSF